MFSQNTATGTRSKLAAPGALLLILVTLMVLAGDRMNALESVFYDFLQKQNAAQASNRIVLVDISSSEEDEEFWNIERFKPVVEKLNEAGAALIVPIDSPPANLNLPDIEQLTALAELEQRTRRSENSAQQEMLFKQLNGFHEQHRQRKELAQTVSEAGNIVLPFIARPTRQDLEDARDECLRMSVNKQNLAESGSKPWVRKAAGTLMLPELLCNGAVSAGYANYWPDDDGVVRHNHLLVKSGDRVFPTLALAIAKADQEEQNLQLESAYRLQLAERNIDTGPGYTNLIRYYPSETSPAPFRSVSADEITSLENANEIFSDNIVLLGNLEESAGNQFMTPVGESMSMPFLVATTLSNLLQEDFVKRPYWLGSAELAMLIVIGIVILLSIQNLSIYRAVTITLILSVILLSIEAYVLYTFGVWVQLVTATLFSILGIISIKTLTPRPVPAVASASTETRQPERQIKVAEEDELDLNFSILRQQPPTDETKKSLYDIAMTHGKRREYAKAEKVLLFLESIDPEYRDVNEKLKKLSGARARKSMHTNAGSQDSQSADGSDKTNGTTNSGNRTLGRYIIEETLGRGAMATVYLGRDPKINRKVAIKTIALAEEFSEEDLENAKSQFIREAESAGRLNHPNIITIYDTGEDGNVAYLAMEYFAGQALNCHTQAETLLPPDWVIELMARAAEALHYAHGQGVVHRDIKPANLMYDAASDQLKITDFGIARLTDTSRTKTGIILGTPSYMSPEQLAASAVTGSSDLYSLGITMYQLLTGTTPFRSDSIPKLMDKIMNEEHTPVSSLRDDLPADIDAVMNKVLAKKPEGRYKNGRAMALALRDCCSTLTD